MAQPAVPVNEDRTDLLGIPTYWAKASINPPFLWESWFGQFFFAGLKDNIDPHDLLVEPTGVIDEPPPRPESVACRRRRRWSSQCPQTERSSGDPENYRTKRGEEEKRPSDQSELVLSWSRSSYEVSFILCSGKWREETIRWLISPHGH